MLRDIKKLWLKCRIVRTSFVIVVIKAIIFRLKGVKLLASGNTTIIGLKNIETLGWLKIGLDYIGFVNKYDRTLVRCNGKLKISGDFSIAKGCRVDIEKNAIVNIKSGYVNPFSLIIISHELNIGYGCAISWNVQILDDDFHKISYPGKVTIAKRGISIGDNVWIGSNVTILSGSVIPNGAVVASGSIVRSIFAEENVLIAGNPAKIIRHGIKWG